MQQFSSRKKQRTPPILRRMFVMVIISMMLSLSLLAYIVWQSHVPRPETPASPQLSFMDAGANYDAQNEIRRNLQRLEQGPAQARVITESDILDRKIGLTIDGMLDEITMQQILDIFKRYNATATFFISGMQASSEPEVVQAIVAGNHPVGNYTLNAAEHMETFTQTALVEDFSLANSIFNNLLGSKPSLLKGNATQYTPAFLEAAFACGLPDVVQSTTFLTYHSFTSYEQVQAYVDGLSYRDIVSIKLSGKLDPSEYIPKEVIEQPAIDLKPGAKALNQAQETLSKEERLLRMIEWLLQAIERADFSLETVELRQANGGNLADPRSGLNTTEAAVGYAFCGMGRMDELIGVLDHLADVKGVGTFFVSAKEIESYPEQIELLLSRGQSLAFAAYPKQNADFYSVCNDLFRAQTLLEQYGYRSAKLVMQPWGEIGDELKEAVSAMGCTLVSYDIAFARSDNQQDRKAQEVIDSVYKGNTYGLRRGTVALFRMNYFDRSGLLAELLASIAQTRNAYPVKDIYVLWNNTEQSYTYPLPPESILPEVRNKIQAGQLEGDVLEAASNYYIGNRDIVSREQFPGFSIAEAKYMDKSGSIKNADKAVFLTFDDWGSDVTITRLLNVLEKHGAKATFFVRTEFVPDNPNLLRAIALAGHEIASHTHTHMPLAHDPEGSWSFASLSDEEALALQNDLEESYGVLESIVGDIRLDNGKPALSRLLRPPMMAVSRAGMWAAFDCGFTYIVNGTYTSRDYQAQNAEKLARSLQYSIRAGNIIILHMSDNSVYTADALDRCLTEIKKNTKGPPFKFARLSDYLE